MTSLRKAPVISSFFPSFPYEWKSLKSMVNGKKEYYKEAL